MTSPTPTDPSAPSAAPPVAVPAAAPPGPTRGVPAPGGIAATVRPPQHRPSVIQRRWPGPPAPARPVVLGTVFAAALVGAVSIPLDRPGLGWLIAVLAGTAALLTAAWTRPSRADAGTAPTAGGCDATKTSPPEGPVTTRPAPAGTDATGAPEPGGALRPLPARLGGGGRLGWTLATVALLAVGTVRAAGWLFVLCLLTAGVTACLAVTDGRSTRGLLLSFPIPPAAVFRSLPWAAAGLRRGRGAGTPPGRLHIGRVVATVAVSAVLLMVFGALFASADAAFARLIGGMLPETSMSTVVRWVFLFGAVGAGLLGAAFVLAGPPDLTGLSGRTPRRRVRRSEWAVPVALLDALFAMFVLVQVTVLFGGADHVLETSGLTYAEYARGGFWQLLVVSALTLLVLGGAARWAPRGRPIDRVLIRVLLGLLALLSLVVVASALFRMNVYTEAYGATRLRILVTACELWIGLLFGLVLIAGIRLRATWLPTVALAGAVLALLGLALANPDRMIADRNVDRYRETGRIDLWYLSELSADAVPALDRLPAPLRDCVLGDISRRLEPDDWREANLGRAAARRLLAADPVSAEPGWTAPTALPGSQDCRYR